MTTMMAEVHAMFKSTPCSCPHHVQVHALFKSTPCSSPRLVQVHTLFKSMPCSPSRLFSVHAKRNLIQISTLVLRPHLVLRPRFVLHPRLFSVTLILRPHKTEFNSNKHACSPSTPCSPSTLMETVHANGNVRTY